MNEIISVTVAGLRGPGGVVTPDLQTLHDEAVTANNQAQATATSIASAAANILLDPYFEIVASNPFADGFDHFNGSAPKRALTGPSSGSKTPVLIGAAGSPGDTLSRLFDAARQSFVPGATIYFDDLVWSDGTSAPSILYNFYDDTGTNIVGTVTANGTATAGIQSIKGSMTVPAPASGHSIAKLGKRCAGNGAREWIASFASYVGSPKRTYPGLPPTYAAAGEVTANLTSDPTLMDSGAAGYTYSAGTRTTSDADNPYGGGSIGSSDTTVASVTVKMSSIAAKVGDVITWRALANFGPATTGNGLSFDFLNASGSTISSLPVQAWGAGAETGTVDKWRSGVVPAGTASVRLVASGSGARKIMAFSIGHGWSPPNFARALTVAAGSGSASSTPRRTQTKALRYSSTIFGWNAFGAYGQSLSVGANGTPALTTAQPFNNLTFAGGPRSGGELGGSTASAGPLLEVASSSDGETICSRAGNGVTQRALLEDGISPANMVMFGFTGGRSNQPIASLQKGAGTGYYEAFIAQVQAAHDLAVAAGKTFGVHAVPYLQGENDVTHTTDFAGTYSYYYNALKNLWAQLDTDIRAITGQTQPVQMLLYQTAINSQAAATSGGNQLTAAVHQAQLDLCLNETNFHLVTPCWFFPPATTANAQVHLSNIGYAWMGAYFGRALHQLIVEKVQPQSLRPLGAVANGTKVRISFEVPYAPLVIDTANLTAITDNGFAVFDDTGKRTISKVQISSSGTEVIITIDQALSTNPFVRCAEDYLVPGSPKQYTAACNLRDSCPDVVNIAGTDYPTWHIAPHFKLPIYVTA